MHDAPLDLHALPELAFQPRLAQRHQVLETAGTLHRDARRRRAAGRGRRGGTARRGGDGRKRRAAHLAAKGRWNTMRASPRTVAGARPWRSAERKGRGRSVRTPHPDWRTMECRAPLTESRGESPRVPAKVGEGERPPDRDSARSGRFASSACIVGTHTALSGIPVRLLGYQRFRRRRKPRPRGLSGHRAHMSKHAAGRAMPGPERWGPTTDRSRAKFSEMA